MADAYAIEAKKTEEQAKRYTWGSLIIGVAAVAVTVIGLLTVNKSSGFETVIAHAAYGIPGALLAAYVNSLAAAHRHEAWRLRHIELQIRTANPFLGLLANDGADYLFGGGGDDSLFGKDGADVLVGENGKEDNLGFIAGVDVTRFRASYPTPLPLGLEAGDDTARSGAGKRSPLPRRRS